MELPSLDEFVRCTPLPLAVVEREALVIRACSPAFASAAGCPGRSLEGTALEALLPDDDGGATRHRLGGAVREVRGLRVCRSSDGQQIRLSAWPCGGTGDGPPALAVLALEDLESEDGSGELAAELAANLRQLDEALLRHAAQEHERATLAEEESRARAIFLASVSHELRTPLNSIMGHAQLLEEGIPVALPGPLEKHVRRILSASRHLLSLIEPVVETARSQIDGDEEMEEVNLATVAVEVLDLVRPLAGSKGLALVHDIEGEPTVVVTRRKDLRQILINLLSNAVKFTEAGEVRLRITCGDPCVLEITDTGVGMDPDTLPHVFDRFWRAPEAGAGGSGIGLWVTRTLVEKLGGEIGVESEPGKGSTFRVRLPDARDAAPVGS